MRFGLALFVLALLTACDDGGGNGAQAPEPVSLTSEAVSHYCQMGVLEHPGPKAQIHVAGIADPLFFAQVRDAVAFLKSPDKLGDVTAVYVSDMGAADSWEAPGRDNWVRAQEARFVVGSERRGGMGAPEIVPFADAAAARTFAARHGGKLMTLAEIPAEAALGAVDLVIGGTRQ